MASRCPTEAPMTGSSRGLTRGRAIYGLHFDFFCLKRKLCRKVMGKLKKHYDKERRGYILHFTYDSIDKIPADYEYGLDEPVNRKYRNLKPPIWE